MVLDKIQWKVVHTKTEKKPEDSSRQPANSNKVKKSSMDQLIDDFHKNLPPVPVKHNELAATTFSDGDSMFSGSHLDHSLNSLQDKIPSTGKTFKAGTVTSQSSNWSVASSAASFDYLSVHTIDDKSKKATKMNNEIPLKRRLQQDMSSNLSSLEEVDSSPPGERTPPEGAPSESPEPSGSKETEPQPDHSKKVNPKNIFAEDKPKPSENDDELFMLRKLISEGRIPGLNEKPPPFIPPTPPLAKTATNNNIKQAANPKRQFVQHGTKSGDRPRKNREAPKPPTQEFKPPEPTNDIKFISGRRINSVESINNNEDGPSRRKKDTKSEGIQRSTSMHIPREGTREEHAKDAALAQLIADSTEKKFKLNNLFKGVWKKKHYSFDLS